MSCRIAYEVSLEAPRGVATMRSVVFLKKKFARRFQADHPGSKLHVVEICERRGKITRRGKRSFGRRK